MRQLFLVLAKLLGLLQIVWALPLLASLTMFLATMGMVSESLHQHRAAQIANTLAFSVFYLAMAWVLLFRSEWLADKLKIQDDAEPRELREIVILRAGVKLIGLFFVVSAIPEAARGLSGWIWSVASLGTLRNFARVFWLESTSSVWTNVLPALLQLGLGLFFAFRTEIVLRWIAEEKKTVDEEPSTHSEEPSSFEDE